MSPVSTPPAPGRVTGEQAVPVRDPHHDENLRLAGRVQQLRKALESAARENGELHRELARAHAENQHMRSLRRVPGADGVDRTKWVRVMLADSHSRNP